MGGSASVCCKLPSKNFNSTFVDETLLEGESIMKINAPMRKRFVEFIKGGDWVYSLTDFEDRLSILSASAESTWKRFGYKTPHCSGAKSARSSFQGYDSSSSRSLFTVDPGIDLGSNSVYSKMVMDDCYTAITTSQLFMKEELRSILIAALLPVYFKSEEGLETGDNSGGTSEGEEEEEQEALETRTVNTINITQAKPMSLKTPKTERLQEWLLGAAAMFDSSELEAYLADMKGSWVDDYLTAIHNLPVTVTISTVDSSKLESKIIYANATHCGFFGCKSQLGENIHEVYSDNASTTEQIANAVFTAKKFKRSLQDANGMCRLRALKPVFNSHGQHAYMLGLESYPFEDPILQDSRAVLGEEPFQQIEDLLLMLPMLIRNFKIVDM